MCMYVCVYIHIYIYIHTYIHTYIGADPRGGAAYGTLRDWEWMDSNIKYRMT